MMRQAAAVLYKTHTVYRAQHPFPTPKPLCKMRGHFGSAIV